MDKMVYVTGDKLLTILFPYDKRIVEGVKLIPGRRYVAEEKNWTVPISKEAIQQLKDLGFNLPKKLEALYEPKEIRDVSHLTLQRELYPFQKEGVAFIEKMGGRALVADEMGLGKTIQALAWTQLHSEKRPVVIVCPAHLKRNWRQEIIDTLPDGAYIEILEGKKPYALQAGSKQGFVIVNYDVLEAWRESILDINPQILIIDESHYIKNQETNRTKATKAIAEKIPSIIALTGTPITNRPVEAYSTLQIVNRNLFPNFMSYAKRYCNAHKEGRYWRFDGASNTKELHDFLTRHIMIRRKKKEVLKDLPDKIYTHVEVTADNLSEYKRAERSFIDYIKKTRGSEAAYRATNAEHLVQIETLKQVAVQGKIKQSIQWIADFLEDGEQKLVVYAIHREVLDALNESFKGISVKIDGDTPVEERHSYVRAFQEDPSVRLFIGSIKAAGTGLTLTAASNVLFLELPWTPGDLRQAEDRCHRIGQKDTVNIYHILSSDTIDSKISQILSRKSQVIGEVIDGIQGNVEENVIKQIMKQYVPELQNDMSPHKGHTYVPNRHKKNLARTMDR